MDRKEVINASDIMLSHLPIEVPDNVIVFMREAALEVIDRRERFKALTILEQEKQQTTTYPTMKPFNLQQALAGKKVITRDEREVTQLMRFDLPNGKSRLYGVLGGYVSTWDIDGTCSGLLPSSPVDLFMAPETKE